MTHQGLFDAWVEGRLHLIGEYSGNFVRDWRELIEKAEAYAAEHGLTTTCLDETRECLGEYEEDD